MSEKQTLNSFFQNKKNIAILIGVLILTVISYFAQSNFFKASILELEKKAPSFDGTRFPVDYTLNWTKLTSQQFQDFKSGKLTYENAKSQNLLVPMMNYDGNLLCGTDPSKLGWSGNDVSIRNNFLTYVTAYMAKYTSGTTKTCEGEGSHLAQDIRGVKGTPILAIANGALVKVKSSSSGNTVCIQHFNVPSLHDAGVKTSYVSCYLHLDSITSGIAEGQAITKGTQIGTLGNTGFATTYHLHFQLDTQSAPFHPYWPFTSAESSGAGLDAFTGINAGLGKENAMKYTVNGMDWVQKYRNYNTTASVGTPDVTPIVNTVENKNVNSAKTNSNVNSIVAGNKNANVALENKNQNINTVLNANKNVNAENLNINKNTNSAPPAGMNNNKNSTLSSDFFSDVSVSSPYYESIKTLKDMDILGGYPDGTFKPNQNVSRVEAVKLLVNAFNIPLQTSSNVSFPDTSKNEWYYPYLVTAVQKSIVKGYPDGSFKPTNTIIRSEFAKVSLETAKIANLIDNVQHACNDVSEGSWYFLYADYFCQNNILNLVDSKFEAEKNVTRGEFALGLYRIKKLLGQIE